jgi:very-short-patch-repair endonuclease
MGLRFDFHAWAARERFEYPADAGAVLDRVGSPAEAHFVREAFQLPGTWFDGEQVIYLQGAAIRVQVPCGPYSIDAVVERDGTRLAIEIDGLAYHGRTQAQFEADYRRERYVLTSGYVVIRFTASETLSNPRACWRSTFRLLRVRRSLDTSSASSRSYMPKSFIA